MEGHVDALRSRNAVSAVWVAAAAAVTVLDGFDAFSLALTAPHIRADLGIPTSGLGAIFSGALTGMILGAMLGGALADRIGRQRTLTGALAVFGAAALAMPLATTAAGVLANRLAAGVGLGAAAPIAVALLNQRSASRPSELVIALVWAGIPAGGIVAALYNQFVIPAAGWRSMFLLGGVLPVPVWLVARFAFGAGQEPAVQAAQPPAAGVIGSLGAEGAIRVSATAAMFFFGYVTTSVIVSWLPTMLAARSASPTLISATFAAVNGGGVVVILALGALATRARWRPLLPLAWSSAATCGLLALVPGLTTGAVAALAVLAATLAAGAQGISVALANGLGRGTGREGTTIGFMTGFGRVGQAAALAASGTLMTVGRSDMPVFALAGGSALVAAAFAVRAAADR